MSVVSEDLEPLTFVFKDDGLVPNNPMPLLVYEQAIEGHRSRWWIWRSKRSAGAEVSACRRDAH